MRLRDVEIVLAVAEFRSFSKAAEHLYLTQPAISQSVKRVEDDFGAPIFQRTKSGLDISIPGRQAIKALCQIQKIYRSDFEYNKPPTQVKIGLSMLLHGLDMVPVVNSLYEIGIKQVEIEISPSKCLAGRSDLDAAILASSHGGYRRGIEMARCWVGKNTGTQIRLKMEHEGWNGETLPHCEADLPCDKIIEVSDFGYAYQLALSGLGITPSVLFNDDMLKHMAPGLPRLSNVRFEIVSENDAVGEVLAACLNTSRRLPISTRTRPAEMASDFASGRALKYRSGP
jgi:DNA-binding transcriptional LysR family regulator